MVCGVSARKRSVAAGKARGWRRDNAFVGNAQGEAQL